MARGALRIGAVKEYQHDESCGDAHGGGESDIARAGNGERRLGFVRFGARAGDFFDDVGHDGVAGELGGIDIAVERGARGGIVADVLPDVARAREQFAARARAVQRERGGMGNGGENFSRFGIGDFAQVDRHAVVAGAGGERREFGDGFVVDRFDRVGGNVAA